MTRKPDAYEVSLFAGVVLLLLGMQLRMVDAYVLNPATTNVLARVAGPSADTPQGTLHRLVLESTQPRHAIRPPHWLGWACLSLGGVLAAFGVMHKWRKR